MRKFLLYPPVFITILALVSMAVIGLRIDLRKPSEERKSAKTGWTSQLGHIMDRIELGDAVINKASVPVGLVSNSMWTAQAVTLVKGRHFEDATYSPTHFPVLSNSLLKQGDVVSIVRLSFEGDFEGRTNSVYLAEKKPKVAAK